MRHILEGGRSGFFLVSHTSGIKYRNGTLHSCQASDLFGGNGWPRLLQHASEMFVANLALPFKEEMKWEKKRYQNSVVGEKTKRYTFGRSSTASFESVREPRRCEEATIWRNWKERAKPNFEFKVSFLFSFFPVTLTRRCAAICSARDLAALLF